MAAIASLLHGEGGPLGVFPRQAAVLGRLPPSTPLSVAAAWLALADLPLFQSSPSSPRAAAGSASAAGTQDAAVQDATRQHTKWTNTRSRVLVLTGPRETWHASLQAADELHLRTVTPRATDAMQRTDIRYAPSVAHARVLLGALSSSLAAVIGRELEEERGVRVPTPGLIVGWDLAGLGVEAEESEGHGPGEAEGMRVAAAEEAGAPVEPGGEAAEAGREAAEAVGDSNRFSQSTTSSTYLSLISALLDTGRHLDVPVLILEPRLDGHSSLPILPPGAEGNVPARERAMRIDVKNGLERLLGDGRVGVVEAVEAVAKLTTDEFELVFAAERARFKRSVGTRSEFAVPPGDVQPGGEVWAWR